MSMSEPTSEQKITASMESLKESLNKNSESASTEAKAHAERLIEMGETYLKMQRGRAAENISQMPHQLSLSISWARIVKTLKVMGLSAVAWLAFLVLWNFFTH